MVKDAQGDDGKPSLNLTARIGEGVLPGYSALAIAVTAGAYLVVGIIRQLCFQFRGYGVHRFGQSGSWEFIAARKAEAPRDG